MKHIIATICIFLCYITSAQAQSKQEELVKKAFESYRKAILTDKGPEAVNYVDSRTIKYYSDVLEWVKTYDSAKVEALNMLDKTMVLSIRHRTPRTDILTFNGRDLLVYAIKSGMVGKNGVSNAGLGKVSVTGAFAKGVIVASGKSTSSFFHFYKEEGEWKIDLTSLFPLTNALFKSMVKDSDKDETGYILYLLEIITGRKPSSDIWQPVR